MDTPVIYTAVDDTLPNRERGEASERIVQGERPQMGDILSMGTEREWRVVRVEAYRSEGRTVYVATVAPEQSEPVEPVRVRVEYPSLAFSIILSPQQAVISYAWEMEGTAPSGRLEGYRFDPEGGIAVFPLEWIIDAVQTCEPEEPESTFAQIHLCWCRWEAIAPSGAA